MACPRRRGNPSNAVTSGVFRSGLERTIDLQLQGTDIVYAFESNRIPYVKEHMYLPDFMLPAKAPELDWSEYRGIIIEAKGRFLSSDRTKHLLIQKAWPNLDVRFVFSRSKAAVDGAKVRKDGTRMTCAEWCETNGFKYHDKVIPQEWLEEAEAHG